MPEHKLKVHPEQSLTRLDIFLSQNLSEAPSRTFVKKLIDTGCVSVNEVIVKAHYKVQVGDEVVVEIPEYSKTPERIEPENIPLEIFYEDDYLIVVNKPTGMLVHPAGGVYSKTLVNALLYHYKKLSDVNSHLRAGIVHRLDQNTSGLIIVAKDNKTHVRLAQQFQKRKVRKSYIALVEREVEFDEGVIDAPLGRHPRHRDKKSVQFDDSAKEALTYYKVVKRHKNVSLISLFPKTGRTHQLRVHMHYLKHPILGDEKYGKKKNFPRLALHAQSVGIIHPHKQYYLEFVSKPPQEFLSKVCY